ncbi:hypothetical protein GCM10027290_16780 [Micromonospora sonneratiae]|uniref:Protein-arginine deiminase family protein n=1 Tax=Micromonospora sonneratiae TaxID=1184706 RepID=A0ABW3YGL2_9ACTN
MKGRAIGLVLLTVATTIPAMPAFAATRVLLRADVNRDGVLSADDDRDRHLWTAGRGAIVLPNLDDDQRRCPPGESLSDDALAACNDAADEVVNGTADLMDLAPLRVEPLLADSATLSVSTTRIRLFARRDGGYRPLGPTTELTSRELRYGVTLAAEARDIVRDPAGWDGTADVTLRARRGDVTRSDQVRLRVAPLLFQHRLLPVRQMMVADMTPLPERPGEHQFRRDLRRELVEAGVRRPFLEYPVVGDDIWMQDLFEPAYLSAPGPGGREQRMTIYLRVANPNPDGWSADRPLRPSARGAFTRLRGPDVGAVQQYDPQRVADPAQYRNGTFDSAGNFDTIPPYGVHRTGRMLYGARAGTDFGPDPTFTRMLAAQGYQAPVVVDTSWLAVGHTDEFLAFVPARNSRGWALLVADPGLGLRLLERLVSQGAGGQRLVQGVAPELTEDPGLTVAEAVGRTELREGTRLATIGVNRALGILRRETGLTESEIVRVPALFSHISIDGYPRDGLTYLYLPGAANGVSTGTGTYLAPKQHGPRDRTGVDVFQRAAERALDRVGVRTGWVETWEYSHTFGLVGGEVDCVTNAVRDLSGTTPWWTSPS